ncbi:hypothetical protein [Microcoleus sp.]|uniref:hypothetical protein n=1 Tax=Microcoleus sp. TaxID=44472 RepID=UPI00403E3A28
MAPVKCFLRAKVLTANKIFNKVEYTAVLKKVRYALCPMPYALCPMPMSTSSF